MLKVFYRKTFTLPNRYLGGESIFVAILTCIIISVMGVSLTRLHNASFRSLVSSEITMQAQHYAKTKMDYLVFCGYNSLSSQVKASIADTNFKDSVTLGTVSTDSNGISRRNVVVNVYNGDETTPRATLSQVFYSNDAGKYVYNDNNPNNSISMSYENGKVCVKVDGVETELVGGVPVGSIMAWPYNSIPTSGGTWLLCDGSTFSSSQYPKLYALAGTDVLPDLRGRFLQGSTTAGTVIEAGLPNISGRIISDDGGYPYSAFAHSYEGQNTNRFAKGCFFVDSYTSVSSTRPYGMGSQNQDRADGALAFEASRSNPIYGASETVQPPAFIVRYYIKAA